LQALSYVDVCESSSENARENERRAFDKGLALLEAAAASPADQRHGEEAVSYQQALWGILIRDLTDPANDLSDDLKANLISIGLWVMRETDAIVAGRSHNWRGLIDINRTIREGLA
jgi:flagellar protein FlaF